MSADRPKVHEDRAYADTLRSAVHAPKPEQPPEEDPDAGRKLVRNMLASFIIGSVAAGGVAYHYTSGWNPLDYFGSDETGESATSREEKEPPQNSYQAPPKSTEETQLKEDPEHSVPDENIQVQASEFKKCPHSFHLKMLLFDPSTSQWGPITKRTTQIDPSQKEVVIAVKRINKGFKNVPLFYDGFKPRTTTVDEKDPSITYVIYNCKDKKIKNLLAQISINVEDNHYGPKSFNIEKCGE